MTSDRYLYWLHSLHLLRRVLTFPAAQPVADSWARIDAWMQRHAPASYALLAPPADPAEVEAAQKAMGIRFPADLLESLACHNGITEWDNLVPGRPPMSVAGILAHWQMCVEIAGDDPDLAEVSDGSDEEPWWHPQWIPWAQSDGDSDVIDMREGPGQGRLGSAAHDDTGHFHDGWPSLATYLAAVADAFEYGSEVDGDVPFLTTEGTVWWDGSGTTVLNGTPPHPRATLAGAGRCAPAVARRPGRCSGRSGRFSPGLVPEARWPQDRHMIHSGEGK
ncbi:SMI1/KNR4 family protein [Streptomyces sp. NBC_00029]|uniref:SMI1/KNR4 family protein n=1 Tax=Streptomyces sp. NBC_00029 TaxID=2903613 RepID=UPI0038666D36